MTFDEIRKRVEANHDVLSVRMEELRDAMGVRRLGPHVCEQISERLAGQGIGHTPQLVPDGWQEVRLYKIGTSVGTLISSATTPGEDGDNRLRELAANEPAQIIEQVRALVCN